MEETDNIFEKRKAFNFYRSYWEIAQKLDDENRLKFYDAVMNKQFTNEEPEIEGLAELVYSSQKHSIDAQVKGFIAKSHSLQTGPTQGGAQGGCQGGDEGGSVAPSVQEKEKEKEKGEEQEQDSDFVDFGGLKFPTTHIKHSETFVSSSISLQTFMQQNKIKSISGVKTLLMEFIKHLNVEEKNYTESKYKDFKRHFLNWHRRVPKDEQSAVKSTKKLPDGMRPAEFLS